MGREMEDLIKLIPFEVEVQLPDIAVVNPSFEHTFLGKTWTVVGCRLVSYRNEYLLIRKGELPHWLPMSCLVVSS